MGKYGAWHKNPMGDLSGKKRKRKRKSSLFSRGEGENNVFPGEKLCGKKLENITTQAKKINWIKKLLKKKQKGKRPARKG